MLTVIYNDEVANIEDVKITWDFINSKKIQID